MLEDEPVGGEPTNSAEDAKEIFHRIDERIEEKIHEQEERLEVRFTNLGQTIRVFTRLEENVRFFRRQRCFNRVC